MSKWTLYGDRIETGQPDTAKEERRARRAKRRENRRYALRDWWRRWGEDAIDGAIYYLAMFATFCGIIAWAIVADVRADDAWDRECVARGGQVTDVSWVPPDQRVEEAYTYCMIDGKAVGTR